jgi:hypothetical protein
VTFVTSTFHLLNFPVLASHHHYHTVLDCQKSKLWNCNCGYLSCHQLPVNKVLESIWWRFASQPWKGALILCIILGKINVTHSLKVRRTIIGGDYDIIPNSGLISVPGKIVPLTMLAHVPTETGPFQILYSLLHLRSLHEPVNRVWKSSFYTCFMYKQPPSTIVSVWVS